jgi:two-component system nitrogen regulation response regulator GlnG
MRTLLLVDDESHIHFTVGQVFADQPLRLLSAETAEAAMQVVLTERPDVVLLDIRLGRKSGLELFLELRRIDPKLLVIFITGHGTADTAIEAMKLGAFEYLMKPLDFTRLREVVDEAFEISRQMRVPTVIDQSDSQELPEQFIGSGAAMQIVCKQIGRVAPQDINVLILGESGTGKELVARALYQHSRRAEKPFLAINCGAIAESLLESELFGHEKGAFTGADRRRIGRFEQCHGGTLFLDEAGDMPQATQVKLLRVLQEGTFERVGGNETVSVNVRVIAATNQNLDTFMEQGRFRRDLYYRLKGVTIHLPPLRERSEDIAELSHYFLFRLNRELGTSVQAISPDALDLLQRYSWPGNIRELHSALREALIASAGSVLLPQFLPPEIHAAPVGDSEPISLPEVHTNDWSRLGQFVEAALANRESDLYRRAIEHFDRELLVRALAQVSGHQANAATLLGLSRPTLRAKLRAQGMTLEKVVSTESKSPPDRP